MEILSTSTWILILFDVVGVWLIVRPSDLVNLWSARRVPVSNWDRFFARLLGVIMLSAQITHWVGQAKNSSAERIMHWFLIAFWFAAVVFLGYHFVGLFASKPDRQSKVDEARRRFLLSESEEQSRIRYRAAWHKYRRLRVLFPLTFLGWLPFAYVASAAFRFVGWNTDILMILLLAWVPFMGISMWQWAFWQCPRCGYAFKGIYDPFFPKRCHYCELPVWAESPDQ